MALGYEVHIIAQDPNDASYVEQGVQIHPIAPFERLSLGRRRAQRQIEQQALAIQADLYVLHTPELLRLGQRLKAQLGARIVYDVHEDYAFTLQHAAHYPAGIRGLMAAWVRRREKKALDWLDGVWYAEQIYDNILGARSEQTLVLENTFTRRALTQIPPDSLPPQPYLLYCGTIAEDWGIWEALELWEHWCAQEPIRLVIAGHSQFPELIQKIQQAIQQKGLAQHFSLIGGTEYVPYPQIVALIQHCYAGLGLYRLRPDLIGKIPTKFYEFLAAQKPLIYTDEWHWNRFNQQHSMGIGYPEAGPLATAPPLAQAVAQWYQATTPGPTDHYLWEQREEKRMAAFLKRLGL